MYPVVAVNKHDVIALRRPQALIARTGDTAVRLMDYPDAIVLLGKSVADVTRAIGRSVINKDQFNVLLGRIQDALNARPDILLDFIDRNND